MGLGFSGEVSGTRVEDFELVEEFGPSGFKVLD